MTFQQALIFARHGNPLPLLKATADIAALFSSNNAERRLDRLIAALLMSDFSKKDSDALSLLAEVLLDSALPLSNALRSWYPLLLQVSNTVLAIRAEPALNSGLCAALNKPLLNEDGLAQVLTSYDRRIKRALTCYQPFFFTGKVSDNASSESIKLKKSLLLLHRLHLCLTDYQQSAESRRLTDKAQARVKIVASLNHQLAAVHGGEDIVLFDEALFANIDKQLTTLCAQALAAWEVNALGAFYQNRLAALLDITLISLYAMPFQVIDWSERLLQSLGQGVMQPLKWLSIDWAAGERSASQQVQSGGTSPPSERESKACLLAETLVDEMMTQAIKNVSQSVKPGVCKTSWPFFKERSISETLDNAVVMQSACPSHGAED